MVEIVISVAAKIAEYLVAPVGRQFRYLWNYKTNLENLKKEVEKLEAKRDTVQLLIKPGEDPLPDVKLWQEKVNQIIIEASKVVEDNPEQANTKCCKGFSCPNLMNRYQLSKKAGGKLKSDVVDLEAAKFEKVAYPTIPEQAPLQPSKGEESFESRKSILEGIIGALRDRDVNMVGIYGMGGVGKTTLAWDVVSKAKQHNLFEKIVFVEVSESPDINNIQGVIAYNLGLELKEIPESERPIKLRDQLKKEGRILLVLDNIWKGFRLEKVGIPFKDHKGLKLLLTTRSCDVLTNEMYSQCNFQVKTLNEAEAWSIFKDAAGTCIEKPELQSIALEVAKECGGLPLAIVAVAKALNNKEEYSWITALRKLKSPAPENFEGKMTNDVYKSIKLSYDYLDTTELKKIFLLCSRMGRTYDASIRDLFRYGSGLGFFESFFESSSTLENAQCNVEHLVKNLKDNSLLLDARNETSESHSHAIFDGERFAMHDIICDVARSIAREEENVCTVIDDVISCSWAKKNILKSCTSITLYNIGELPKDLKLVLPQLEFFYMKPKKTFSRITDDFFTDISSLLVLHLIEMNLSPLPTSLSHLVNLQTLCLDACKLGDIADIVKLKKLEFLSFCGSKFKKLPEEMHQLTRVRLLDLNDCSELEIIPQNFLSCFTRLEALYMYNTLITWEGRGLNLGRILDELKHLRGRLTTLEISIPNVKMSEGLLSPHLKRYKISIDRDWILPPMNSRTLRVKLNTNDNAGEVFSQLRGIKQLELVADSRDDFTDSKLSVSPDALSSLESLSLQDLHFEKICNVPLAAESFCQLRTITVHRCDKLTSIFSFSIDKVLPKLQEIEVSSCKNMEGIFAIEREDDVNNSELIHEIKFSQLCSVTLRDLPQLKSFCHRVKTTSQLQLTSSTNDGEIISKDMIDNPKSIFNETVVFPNLENLYIANISAEKIWHNQLPTMSSSFQNLNRLNVCLCHNLKEIFSSSMVNSFVQLQYLEISHCDLLKEMVFMEELKEEERKDIQFPFLKEMTIIHCRNFKGFISDDKIEFPSLKEMEISWCPKFKEFIFSDKVAVPNIEELEISYMDNLEKIWHNQLVNDSFCKLKSLQVQYCEKLLNVFPSNIYGRLLSLESLEVSWCDSLEEIFDLRELIISNSQTMLSFESLQKLRVSECGSLKNLFSASILAKEGVVMEEAPARFLFPKLSSLELDDLPELRSFYPGKHKMEGPVSKKLELPDCGIHDTDEIGFPSLKEMEIQRCPKLKEFIFNDKVAVPNIEELRISSMDNLEKIWHNQLVNDSFCKLKSLVVYDCKKLLNVFPSNICGRLLSLESLEVTWCGSLEEIFDLRELSIYDSQIMLSFANLQKLRVSLCQGLKNLFSASILAKEGVVMEEAPARFLFPKLPSMQLFNLPQLRSFYPGRHKVEGPVLKKLELFDCGIHDTDEEGQMQQPSFFSLVEEAFPCLEELSLDGKQVTMLCQGQFLESLFDRLKILQVNDDDESIFPFGIIQRCQNLEELSLSLSESHYKEIFPHGEDQTQTKIKTLNLSFLYDLTYIWKQNSKLDLIIQHLEVLKVVCCSSLINLMPPPTSFQNPSTSFQNLTSLKVKDCDSLINMGTSTVAKSLVQLTEMSISLCKKLTEVIGNHGDVIEDEIIFRKLKSLKLRSLPSLTSFCSWNFTLKFSSLETLTVQQCSKMKIFSLGDLTMEKLQEVKIDWESVELRPDFNLNTTIQQSYEKANSAKDNGASSSHHFEIDQESIQQFDEEAIQQSHKEANEDYSASSSDHSE